MEGNDATRYSKSQKLSTLGKHDIMVSVYNTKTVTQSTSVMGMFQNTSIDYTVSPLKKVHIHLRRSQILKSTRNRGKVGGPPRPVLS